LARFEAQEMNAIVKYLGPVIFKDDFSLTSTNISSTPMWRIQYIYWMIIISTWTMMAASITHRYLITKFRSIFQIYTYKKFLIIIHFLFSLILAEEVGVCLHTDLRIISTFSFSESIFCVESWQKCYLSNSCAFNLVHLYIYIHRTWASGTKWKILDAVSCGRRPPSCWLFQYKNLNFYKSRIIIFMCQNNKK